jgi:hypothetical protein
MNQSPRTAAGFVNSVTAERVVMGADPERPPVRELRARA